MQILLNSLIIFGCILGLWGGSVWVVISASNIAKRLGLSELVIGLTIVAIATSAPEFAVTIFAALNGQPEISVGNVVGSNIFNLGIILGFVAIFSTLSIKKELVYRDGLLLLATAVMLLIFFYDNELSTIEGIFLFSTLIIYLFLLIRQKGPVDDYLPTGEYKWYDILKIIIGAGVVIVSANFFVDAATELASIIGVSQWIIGITIVAAGTSLPELATTIVALHKGKYGLTAGNLIGSDLFNMLGVLGAASILRPLKINEGDYLGLAEK